MSTLTERQRLELHKSLLQYLVPLISENDQAKNKQDLIELLYSTLGIDEQEFQSNLRQTVPENYLAKKWTAVLRLQKKILELEHTLDQYKTLNGSGLGLVQPGGKQSHEWIPTKLVRNLKNFGGSSASVVCCDIHPSEPILACGTNEGAIIIWDLQDLVEPLKVLKNAHTKNVNCVKFSRMEINLQRDPNGKKEIFLASCSSDLMIKIWDASYQSVRSLTGHDHLVSSVAFHPMIETQLISCSRDKAVKIWDFSSGWCLKTFVGHSDWVRNIDVSITGQYVLSCSNDQSVRLSHLDSGTGIGLMVGHGQVVESCKLFETAKSNVFLDKLCLKYVYNNNEADFKLLSHETYDELGYKYCVTCGRDDTIKLWLLPLPQLRPHRPPLPSSNPAGTLILTLSQHSSWVRDLQIHPNGKYLFSCSDDKTVKVWDLSQDCKCVQTLAKHESFVNCITLADPIIDKDNETDCANTRIGYRNYFVSGGVDKTVVWG